MRHPELKTLTQIPFIGPKRSSLLIANGINDLCELAQVTPERIVEILGGGVSLEQAQQIVKYAKKEIESAAQLKWHERLIHLVATSWKWLLSVAALLLLAIEIFNGIYSADDNVSKASTVKVYYSDSLDSSYKKKSSFELNNTDTSVTNIAIPYRDLGNGEWAICGALPFLMEAHAKNSIKQLTLIFDIEYPSIDILNVASEAGYGRYYSDYTNACAYGEKTLFSENYGRTKLERKFFHGENSTRVVYNFFNLTPDELAPLSVVIPFYPNAFPVYGNPPKQPFVNSPGESDFSQEALNEKELTLYADPIKVSISYIIDGPRKDVGNLLVYVHPAYVNADLVFRASQLAKSNGYNANRTLSQIWSSSSYNLLIQSPETAVVKKELFNDLLDSPEDEALLRRQYKEKVAILTLLPTNSRIQYVRENSKVLASIESVLRPSGTKLSFPMKEYNEKRNIMRMELMFSHQLPNLFQKYLNSED